MVKKPVKTNKLTLTQGLPRLLLIGGAIGLIAMTILATEIFQHYREPSFLPVCNLNPILSCTNVASTWQAHALGFPNYFLAMAGFSILATLGTVLLAGAKFKRWLWRLTEAGVLFAFVFITWLQYQTLYQIGSLCLFCIVGWAVMGPMFWYTTLYNLREGHIKLPKRFNRAVSFAYRHHADILVTWYLVIILLILKRFWYYWSTLG